ARNRTGKLCGSACSHDSIAYRRSCLCGTQDPGADQRPTSNPSSTPLFRMPSVSSMATPPGSRSSLGQEANLVAFTTTGEFGDDTLKELRGRPRTLASAPLLASMVRDLVPRVVSDTETDQRIAPSTRETARVRGWRSLVGVPMVRQGQAIGAITVTRRDAGTFADKEIALIKTFADQAVIAIENTRLFEEVQARTRDATEALEYQAATSDVLEAISRSPTDAGPVFDMIAKSAARLCAAQFCHVFRFDGELIHFVASHGHSAEALEATQGNYPMHPGRGTAAAR